MMRDSITPDEFYCLLAPPAGDGNSQDNTPRQSHVELMVNPHCWFVWQQPTPAELIQRIGRIPKFHKTDSMVWVDDPVTRILKPFWFEPEMRDLLIDIKPGEPFNKRIPAGVLRVLQEAEILVSPEHWAAGHRRWTEALRLYASQMPSGFVAIQNLIHPYLLEALRRYLRYLTGIGRFWFGDLQSDRRYVANDEPVAAFFHRQLVHVVSEVAGASVIPSYSYLSLYQGGARLPRHTDQHAACEYTLSIAIDATPEPNGDVPWPIHLQMPNGRVSVRQHLGEGLLFRGREIPHWRDPLAIDQTYSSILFHYMPSTLSEPMWQSDDAAVWQE